MSWDDLDRLTPGDFTLHTAPRLIAKGHSWADLMPEPEALPADLIAEGRAIPVARGTAHAQGQAAGS